MIQFLFLLQENLIFNIFQNPDRNFKDNVIVDLRELKKELKNKFSIDVVKFIKKNQTLRIVISEKKLDLIIPWLEEISESNVIMIDPHTVDLEFETEIIIAK